MKYIAQTINIEGSRIKGPLAEDITLGGIINNVLGFLFPVAGVILFLMIVLGGFNLLTSQGDAEKIKNGKAVITTSLIGFFLLILSFFLVRFLAFIFGLNAGILK